MNILGASFFFSRDQIKRRSTDYLFQTLAFQLGCNKAFPLQDHITKALENESLLDSSPDAQLKTLILGPLALIVDSITLPVLIVLDAVDECDASSKEQESALALVIELLAQQLRDCGVPIKILVTSRPDEHIRKTFFLPDVESNTGGFVLHEIDRVDTDKELHLFISARLREVAFRHRDVLDHQQWPSDDQLRALVRLSGRLFITAATLVRLIDTKTNGGPVSVLKSLVQASRETVGIDTVYMEVLRAAVAKHRNDASLKSLIAWIILSFDQLSAPDLDRLLGFQTTSLLQSLQAVVHVAPEDGSVRAIHASFYDFITDNRRCVDHRFSIEEKSFHYQLALSCLTKLKTELRRNLLNVGGPSIMNKDTEKQSASISNDLRYAARFWGLHLMNCTIDDALFLVVEKFVSNDLLCWIETLSHVGEIRQGLGMLENLIPSMAAVLVESSSIVEPSWIAGMRNRKSKVSVQTRRRRVARLLKDCRHFIIRNFEAIDEAAMHVYYSALTFTPRHTNLYRQYKSMEGIGSIQALNGVEGHWNACLRTLEMNHVVHLVSIHRGEFFLLGSESNILVGDFKTGQTKILLKGHSERVQSVAISSDGSFAVSASSYDTLRIWNLKTGQAGKILEEHSKDMHGVAISSDACFVASGFRYGGNTVRIWDLTTGKALTALEGHSKLIRCTAISSDGSFAVSSSFDQTVRIWDLKVGSEAAAGLLEERFQWVKPATISRDGAFAMSSRYDGTTWVWDLGTGKVAKVLQGNPDRP